MPLPNRCAALRTAAAVGCVIAVFALIAARLNVAASARTFVVRVQAADFLVGQRADPSEKPAVASPVEVNADATRLQATADTECLIALRRRMSALEEMRSAERGPSRDWFVWGRLGSPTITVSSRMAESVGAYGVRFEDGVTVCLFNKTERKISTLLRLHLPCGVYTIERVIFSPADAAVSSPAAGVEAPAVASRPFARLDRLEGCDIRRARTITKPLTLEPGQVCVYRCSDQAARAHGAIWSARYRLQLLSSSAPGPARRLRRMLAEGTQFMAGLSPGTDRDPADRLRGIHRLLLVTAQTQSLLRNYLGRGVGSAAAGSDVKDELERLADALAETSATLLGLVPQITVAANGVGTAERAGGDSRPSSYREDQPRAGAATVTVSLANTGIRTVSPVKLGLDGSALPAGTGCDPFDPAVFGGLRPGQTVRAAFRLHYRKIDSPAPEDHCVGDVSFFVAGAPAHLRPRVW